MALLDRVWPRRLTAVAAAAVAAACLAAAFPAPVSARQGPASTGTEAPASTLHGGTTPSSRRCISNCVFVLDRGRFETIELPFLDNHQDFVRFNNRGDIVGAYVPDNPPSDLVNYRGYHRDRRGRIELVDVPGAIATHPYDINDRGQIVGASSATPAGERTGFLRDRHGRYRTIHPPQADVSQAFGINDRGHLVGEYADASGVYHGYLRTNGRFVKLDVPGAAATSATDLNDRGEIVGLWLDPDGGFHGFLRDRRGRYQTFEAPFDQAFLFPPAINNRGQIVGAALTLSPDGQLTEAHGYLLRHGVDGPVTRIDFPGADFTGAFAISDRGTIIGLYGPHGAAPNSADPMPEHLAAETNTTAPR
jgi:probable HAF family extracellular repeat protein